MPLTPSPRKNILIVAFLMVFTMSEKDIPCVRTGIGILLNDKQERLKDALCPVPGPQNAAGHV